MLLRVNEAGTKGKAFGHFILLLDSAPVCIKTVLGWRRVGQGTLVVFPDSGKPFFILFFKQKMKLNESFSHQLY